MHKTKIALCKSPMCSLLDNQEALKDTLRATTFEVEENSRTSPKIQGLARLCKPCYFTQQAIVEKSHLFVWHIYRKWKKLHLTLGSGSFMFNQQSAVQYIVIIELGDNHQCTRFFFFTFDSLMSTRLWENFVNRGKAWFKQR